MDTIEGEKIEIPVNFDDSKELQPHEASLALYQNNRVITNMSSRIKIEKAKCGLYHFLVLESLESGTY